MLNLYIYYFYIYIKSRFYCFNLPISTTVLITDSSYTCNLQLHLFNNVVSDTVKQLPMFNSIVSFRESKRSLLFIRGISQAVVRPE